ncbi:MAG: hypothetical protein P9M06_00070 [Candidatus Saelkia tenebricola]|nr:hypothetical protein [Candidatus Saelkia tenebricola]
MVEKEKTKIAKTKATHLILPLIIIAVLFFKLNALAITIEGGGFSNSATTNTPILPETQSSIQENIFPSLGIDTDYTQNINNDFNTFLNDIVPLKNMVAIPHLPPGDILDIQENIAIQTTGYITQLCTLREKISQDLNTHISNLQLLNEISPTILKAEGIDYTATNQMLVERRDLLQSALETVNSQIETLEAQLDIATPAIEQTTISPAEEEIPIECILGDLGIENPAQFNTFLGDLTTFSQDIYPLLDNQLRNQFQKAIREKIIAYKEKLSEIDSTMPNSSIAYDIITGHIEGLNNYLTTISGIPESAHEIFLGGVDLNSLFEQNDELKNYLDENYATLSPAERSATIESLFALQTTLQQWTDQICPENIIEASRKIQGGIGKLLLTNILTRLEGYIVSDWRETVINHFDTTLNQLNARNLEIDNAYIALQELSDYYKTITSSVINQENQIQIQTQSAASEPPTMSLRDELHAMNFYRNIINDAENLGNNLDILMKNSAMLLPDDYVWIAPIELQRIKIEIAQIQSSYENFIESFGETDLLTQAIENLNHKVRTVELDIASAQAYLRLENNASVQNIDTSITNDINPETPALSTTITIQTQSTGSNNDSATLQTPQEPADNPDIPPALATTIIQEDSTFPTTRNEPQSTNDTNPSIQLEPTIIGNNSSPYDLIIQEIGDNLSSLGKSYATTHETDQENDYLTAGLSGLSDSTNNSTSQISSAPYTEEEFSVFQDLVATWESETDLNTNERMGLVVSFMSNLITMTDQTPQSESMRKDAVERFSPLFNEYTSRLSFLLTQDSFVSEIINQISQEENVELGNTDINVSAKVIGFIGIDGTNNADNTVNTEDSINTGHIVVQDGLENGTMLKEIEGSVQQLSITTSQPNTEIDSEDISNIEVNATSENLPQSLQKSIQDAVKEGAIDQNETGAYVIMEVTVNNEKYIVIRKADTIVYINSTKPGEVIKEILKRILINKPNASEITVNRTFVLIVTLGLICIGFGIGLAVYITKLQLKKSDFFNPVLNHNKTFQHNFVPSWKTR